MVAAGWAEKYANHAVWRQITDSRYALKQAGTQEHEGAELARLQLLAALDRAEKAKNTLSPFVTTNELDLLHSHLSNYFPVAGVTGYLAQTNIIDNALTMLRIIPNPTSNGTAKQTAGAIEELTSIRENEIATLEKRLGGLLERAEKAEAELAAVQSTVATEQRVIAGETERLTQAVTGAEVKFETELAKLSQAWAGEQAKQIREFDAKAESEVQVLAATALLGNKLVQHAARQTTAASWESRSKRDLRAANALFAVGGLVFLLAGLLAFYFVWDVTSRNGVGGLSIGESILRISVVITLGGGITYLFAESGRRRREGHSAEEVATVLTSIDAFLATSPEDARTTLMENVGATIFVDNIRSRLSARDAVRGQDASPLAVEDAVRLASDLAKKGEASRAPGTS